LSSTLPNDVKLFVKDEDLLQAQIKPNVQSNNQENQEVSWNWLEANNETVKFENSKVFTTEDYEKSLVYGDSKFEKGIHYWKIILTRLWCCHDFGITQGKLGNNFNMSYHTSSNTVIGLPGKFPGEEIGPATTSLSSSKLENMQFACYLDMDKKIFVIANLTLNKIYKKTKFNFSPAIPYYASRKHASKVVLEIQNKEKVPSWLQDEINKDYFI